ncbi:MAG: type IV toxin-antitoxin system AbiEi family antitoxin domain-containing protein [Lachnospiraceae bacterium]|nr:type IV toxin-antitoxin system AbiEi family antitoxin domain-containing protein [Lachnospiraceae bacterium]
MDINDIIKTLAKRHGGIISTKVAGENGISRMQLTNLCKNKVIDRIARGQYVLADDMQDELLSLSIRSGNLIFSHETALFLHGISDRVPSVYSITYPTGKVPSSVLNEECKVFYVKPELFNMGKTELITPMGNRISGYDLERTICDVVRSRSRVGTETFYTALKMYASRKDKDLNRLYAYAKRLHVEKIISEYMEVLL